MEKFKAPQPRFELTGQSIIRPDWMQSAYRSSDVLHLDKNENIDAEYLSIINRILSHVSPTSCSSYPDCAALYEKLAHSLAVSGNQLLLAAGSDGVIRSAYETFIMPGDAVVFTQPTFAMYSVYNQIFGARACPVVYRASKAGPVLDIDLFIDSVRRNKPKLVCLPNADSPSGTVVVESSLRQIVEAAGSVGAVMLIDEAYYPFHNKTVVPWINEYSHLMVTRTFSKAWGLAGARVGYGVAQYDLIKLLHMVRPMYELGALSVAIATSALDYESDMLASVARLNRGKTYFSNAMRKIGLQALESKGNFMHVAFGDKSQSIHAALKKIVLYRKDFPNTALAGYSRFTSTTETNFKPIVDRIRLAMVVEDVAI